MRTTVVKRYNCDHCKKKGYAAGPMRKHEERCTLNPSRLCAMCNMGEVSKKGAVVPPLTTWEMVAMLPNPSDFFDPTNANYTHELEVATQAALPALREAVKDCPACILAGIRQAGIPVPCSGFDVDKEFKRRMSICRD